MTLSELSWNAIMALATLASHRGDQALRLKDLQQQLQLSRPYTEQLMAKLRDAGLVEGIRGTGGGYYLGRSAQHITLSEIAQATQHTGKHMHWLHATPGRENVQRKIWQQVDSQLQTVLAEMTLADIVHQDRSQRLFQPNQTTHMIANMFPAHSASHPASQHVGITH